MLAIDLLAVLILCTDICLDILEYHAYDMGEIDGCDEVILIPWIWMIMMRV